MDDLLLIGVSHRQGGVEAIEAWQRAFPDSGRLAALGLHQHVLLATCNRWEVLLTLPGQCSAAEVRSRLTPADAARQPYLLQGAEALAQFTRVASSLDSLNPGEDQVMRQVRDAVRLAEGDGRLAGLLAFACQSALRIARQVRRETTLAPSETSLFNLARPWLDGLRPGAPVALLGAGVMARSAARALAAGGWPPLVVNRGLDRARRLAAEVGGSAMALDDFLAGVNEVEALVAATPVAGLIDAALLARSPALRLVVDLGLPRNLTPGAADPERVQVVDIERLQAVGEARRMAIEDQLERAEALVQGAMDEAVQDWTLRSLGPAVARLRQRYLDTIGDMLPPDQARRLADRFAHLPVKGLRALARDHGPEAVGTFLREAELS